MTKIKQLLAICFVLPTLAFADLEVSDGWVTRPIAGVKNAAGYMTLRNTGKTAVEIVAVDCEMAKMCQVHKTIHEGGVAKMREQKFISIDAGGSINFQPGGLHIMVMGISQEFLDADTLPISLILANGEVFNTELAVKALKHHAHH